jgi:translation initiation factor 2 alpha subunit (eIF-2alpha)
MLSWLVWWASLAKACMPTTVKEHDSITSSLQVGRQEPVMVLRVDNDKGYIDLSKRFVALPHLNVDGDTCSRSEGSYGWCSSGCLHSSAPSSCYSASGCNITQLAQVLSPHHLRVIQVATILACACRRVSKEDLAACDEKYNKSKLVHSIMRHVAETQKVDLVALYSAVAWPLYKLYGHAYDAFKSMVLSPEELWDKLKEVNEAAGRDHTVVSAGVKDAIMKNIRRRLTPQPLKIRADLEMTCFRYGGVEHIKVRPLLSRSSACLHSSRFQRFNVDMSSNARWPGSALGTCWIVD